MEGNNQHSYCIYYITTDRYVNYAPNFFKSLHNFMPNDLKTVIWLSDNFIDVETDDKIDVLKKNILDMPWPLVTLLKMHYITDNRINGYDGYFYFNGNAVIEEMSQETQDLLYNSIRNNLFIATNHACAPLDTSYSQGGFFGGGYETFFSICQEVVDEINYLLKKNTIPTWHDETTLNNVLKKHDNVLREAFFCNDNSLYKEEYRDMLNKCNHIFIGLTFGGFKKDKTIESSD